MESFSRFLTYILILRGGLFDPPDYRLNMPNRWLGGSDADCVKIAERFVLNVCETHPTQYAKEMRLAK